MTGFAPVLFKSVLAAILGAACTLVVVPRSTAPVSPKTVSLRSAIVSYEGPPGPVAAQYMLATCFSLVGLLSWQINQHRLGASSSSDTLRQVTDTQQGGRSAWKSWLKARNIGRISSSRTARNPASGRGASTCSPGSDGDQQIQWFDFHTNFMRSSLLLFGLISSQLVGVGAVFVTWGDSLTFGYGGTPYPEQLGALTGITTLNRGVNGETSTQIAARFLAEPALFGEHVVIWAGRNNFLEHEGVQSDIASMVSHLTTTDYLVLGIIPRHDEYLGSSGQNAITAINLDLAATYGTHFIDIQHILVNAYDPLSPAEVLDFALHVIPDSLQHPDALHLNSAGYGVVAHTVADHFASNPEPAQTTLITAIGCAIGALGLRKRRA